MFNLKIRPYQVQPLRAREDLGAMAIKGNSVFFKAPALLDPDHQIVLSRTIFEGALHLFRDAVGVFCSPSRLGHLGKVMHLYLRILENFMNLILLGWILFYAYTIWSNFNLLHNSQRVTFPTQSCMVLFSFCTSLLHLSILW